MRRFRKEPGERDPRLRLLAKACAVCAAAWISLTFLIGVYPVRGNGMFPMCRDGDLAVTARVGGYRIGQVVSYRIGGTRCFGRIVAGAGDTVEISPDGGYTVNGLIPAEEVFYATADPGGDYPLTLAEGEWFLLCDHRPDTADSRSAGPLTADDMDGYIVFLFRCRSF